MTGPGNPALIQVLGRARSLGLLGPGEVARHIEHAQGFAGAFAEMAGDPEASPASFLDLGSGAGVPGLVLALAWPEATAVLLEAGSRRSHFLTGALTTLELDGRVTVCHARAELAGRDPGLRGRFDLVTARSFGAPAVTAECGAPFLGPGGVLVISEPPDTDQLDERWPVPGLAQLALAPAVPLGDRFHYVALQADSACPERYPRRDGVPAKSPLF